MFVDFDPAMKFRFLITCAKRYIGIGRIIAINVYMWPVVLNGHSYVGERMPHVGACVARVPSVH